LAPSPPFRRDVALRYLYWGFWFVLVPLLAACVAVSWLGAHDVLGPLDDAAREQSVPTGIALFSILEALLWYQRHRLPLSPVAAGGIPSGARREFEGASQMLDESERLLDRKGSEIRERWGATGASDLRAACAELRALLAAEPFDRDRFARELPGLSDRLGDRLGPWRKGELREYIESIGIAILVALLLRSVVIEAFKIPSGSMKPTLQIGDHIFVSKFSYGPKIPLLDWRIFPHLPPERGDVMVFEFPDPNPENERQDWIKRVIALPGDTLEVDSGHPIINGWRVPSCHVGTYTDNDPAAYGPRRGELYVEFLEKQSYLTMYEEHHFPQRQGPYQVAPGQVWVMGDNRHNSLDSRVWQGPGGKLGSGVPFANIKGRALMIWFPGSRMLQAVMGTPRLPNGAPAELVQGIERCVRERPKDAETVPPTPSNSLGVTSLGVTRRSGG
jgi:signal peptidase I